MSPWWHAHTLVSSLLCFSLPLHLPRLLPVAAARPPSQGIATGKYHAAVLTNSAEWEAACVKAGRRCGDLVHPLVYCPELHFSEFTSAVADMKNSVAVGVQRRPCCGERSRQSPALGEPKTQQQCGRGSPPPSGVPDPHSGWKRPERGRVSPWSPHQRIHHDRRRGSPLRSRVCSFASCPVAPG